MTLFLDALVAGLAVGSIYGLVAVAFTVVFNATSVFNLAQGDLMMIAVMGSYYVLDVLKFSQWADVPIVIVGVTLVSLVEERVVVRPFLRRTGSFGWFIATLAFSLGIEGLVGLLYGHHPLTAIPTPLSGQGVKVGPVDIVPRQIVLLAALVVIVFLLEVFYNRTWWGKAMRATAQDRIAASLRGIDPNKISRSAFALGGLVAAIAGLLVAPITYSDPTIGLTYTLKGFVALAVGGFGSMRGAVVGGLVLGVSEQMLDLYWNPAYEITAGLFVLLIVLAFRAQGIFGGRALREV